MKTVRKTVPPSVPQEKRLSDQLQDAEMAAAYLNAALAEGDQAAFMLALGNVARARGGISAVSRHTGLNRVALSRAPSERGNPELNSLSRVLEATGLRLVIASGAVPRPRKSRSSVKRSKSIAMGARAARRE